MPFAAETNDKNGRSEPNAFFEKLTRHHFQERRRGEETLGGSPLPATQGTWYVSMDLSTIHFFR